MSLKAGALLMIGLVTGMALSSSLLTVAHARLTTALQVTHCTKVDRAR